MSAPTMDAPVVHEPSAWLRATGAAQLHRVRALGFDSTDPTAPLVLAPLVGRLTERVTEDDRRCDRCGRYCPPGETFLCGLYCPAPRVALVLGLCEEHAAAEGVEP